jgi:hypothetical protein
VRWPWPAVIATLTLVLAATSSPWRAEASPLPAAPAISGLHVVGNQIRDGANSPLRLRGANEPSAEYEQNYYGLITDYGTGAPTAGYGQGYKADLAGLV